MYVYLYILTDICIFKYAYAYAHYIHVDVQYIYILYIGTLITHPPKIDDQEMPPLKSVLDGLRVLRFASAPG